MKRLLFALAAGALFAPAAVRADNLDEQLSLESRKIMKDIKAQGYKNVGVLTFRVHTGKKELLNAGVINSNMVLRVESALGLLNDEKNPVGIVHDAARVAGAKDKKSNFTTAAGREKLLTYQYPMAWGKTSVPVDAFYTGVIMLSKDWSQTYVRIEAFDKRNPKDLRKITDFQCKTDRSILVDFGKSFTLAKQGLKKPKTTSSILLDAPTHFTLALTGDKKDELDGPKDPKDQKNDPK